MTTKSLAYDHAAYIIRYSASLLANTANTNFPAINVAFASLAYSATFTVVTAGTSAAGNNWVINKVSGTTTTALGTATLGTSTAGAVINVPLSTALGGATLLQGDQIFTAKGTDATSVNLLSYELALQPLANITA